MPTTKEFKLEELSKYFHLPEKAVAKELGICLTSLKKLCRSYGITRWPFRKVMWIFFLPKTWADVASRQLKSIQRTLAKAQDESSSSLVASQFIGSKAPEKSPSDSGAGRQEDALLVHSPDLLSFIAAFISIFYSNVICTMHF